MIHVLIALSFISKITSNEQDILMTSISKFAVFGNPIVQSKSPLIHSMFAKELGLEIEYSAIEGNKECVENDFVRFFSDSHSLGANVTMPFKDAAAAWVTELSPNAKAADSVNTIIRNGDRFIGDSTDGVGLVSDLLRLGMYVKDKRILLIGAGGAARGVFANIIEQAPLSVDIMNRSVDKAHVLAKVVENTITKCISDAEQLAQYDLIINATSLSLNEQLPNITTKQLHDNTCIYDMVYKKQDTVFTSWAKQQGLTQVADGLGMLVGQAAESFYLWLGQRPSVEPVLATLRTQMKLV